MATSHRTYQSKHKQDYSKQKYNHWQPLYMTRCDEQHRVWWMCRCDCAAQTEKEVLIERVVNGYSRGCGCGVTQANESRATHGHTIGGKGSLTYQTWIAMKRRCSSTREGEPSVSPMPSPCWRRETITPR